MMRTVYVITAVIALAIASLLLLRDNDALSRVKNQMGTDIGHCLSYATVAITKLEAMGEKPRLRFFDCGKTLHAAACIGERCIESEHRDVVLVRDMGCPLADGKQGYTRGGK